MRNDGKPPRTDGRQKGQPTPQGPKAAGPRDIHGIPPENLRSFHPDDGRPAKNPEAMTRRVLEGANSGPKAVGDAGPLGFVAREDDHGPA